jgi:hypothetical protein
MKNLMRLFGLILGVLLMGAVAQAQSYPPMPLSEIEEFMLWGDLVPLDKRGILWQFSPELRDTRRREVKITVPPSLVYLEVEGGIYPPGQRVTLIHRDVVILKFVRPQKLSPRERGGSGVVTQGLPAPATMEEFLAFGVLERLEGTKKGFVFRPHRPGVKFQVSSQLEKVDTETGECRPGSACVIGNVGTLWFKKAPTR